ncbi:MAG TPA: tetratricopeptide repeat protein [Longimicrobiales bacterium]|nr:tetratricopeptide repeat protein [Longimicrobiales bacterium]
MAVPVGQLKQQGRLAYDRKDFAGALELFRAILAEHPGFADIRHYAGLCLVFLDRPEEALEQLDQALATNPGYVEAHVNRALVLQDLGRYDEAKYAFEQAAEHEQQSQGRFPAAVTARLANAHAGVGDIYAEAGVPAEAAAQYGAALELRPQFHDIRNKYGAALLELGQIDDAIAEFQRVLEWNPRFLAARLNLGLALFRLGRRADAATEWELCRAQQPNHPQVRAFLALVVQADASG